MNKIKKKKVFYYKNKFWLINDQIWIVKNSFMNNNLTNDNSNEDNQ